MANAKHGGQREGAGRITTNLRGLDISDFGAEISPPPAHYATDITIYKCGRCGSVWWEGHTTNAYTWNGEDRLDQVAQCYMEGKPEKHRKDCPENEA